MYADPDRPRRLRHSTPPTKLAAALLLGGCATTSSPDAAAPVASTQPLRQQIEAAYALNRQALLARDAEAAPALRTADFHVVTPDGARHDAEEMAGFSRNLLTNVERWDALSFEIVGLAQEGDDVHADVRQHSSRRMRRPEGVVQQVENWVTQRETWVRTAQGWRIRRVDTIRDQRVLIDGVPRQ